MVLFHDLPKELIFEVFSQLVSGKDLLKCATVCKTWNLVILQNEQLWKMLCLKEWHLKESEFELCTISWKKALGTNDLTRFHAASDELIRYAMDTHVRDALYLEKKNLSLLPMELFSSANAQHLRYLELSRNSIEKIPEKLFDLVNLRTLYLDRNMIVEIPQSISKLTKLNFLDLDSNRLVSLPKSFHMLINLQTLKLTRNPKLRNVSKTFFQPMINLRELHLPANASPSVKVTPLRTRK